MIIIMLSDVSSLLQMDCEVTSTKIIKYLHT